MYTITKEYKPMKESLPFFFILSIVVLFIALSYPMFLIVQHVYWYSGILILISIGVNFLGYFNQKESNQKEPPHHTVIPLMVISIWGVIQYISAVLSHRFIDYFGYNSTEEFSYTITIFVVVIGSTIMCSVNYSLHEKRSKVPHVG